MPRVVTSLLINPDHQTTHPYETEPRLVDTHGNDFTLPDHDYNISQVRAAIPRHCYDRSAYRSLGYVVRDVAIFVGSCLMFERFMTEWVIPWRSIRVVLKIFYVVLQSLNMTGLWVLGHECGHGAFSTSDALNDVVGYVLHSALLVPYFSWKISHRKHHKATNNLRKDMGFVPNTKDHFLRNRHLSTIAELSDETPLYTMFSLLQLQSTGWLVYLLTNATSHNQHERQKEGRGIGKSDGFLHGVNHFNSNSPIFDDKDKDKVHASNIGLLATLAILMAVAYGYGWKLVAIHYFAPYILLNNWIILITSMQHSDPSVPHYLPQSWNWSRGSAATIDRDFGFIGRFFFHSIIESHVLHHHVSTIPFYNAAEASEAMKRVLGRHYRSDTRGGIVGYFKAMWMRIRLYHWVEPTSMKYQGVLFYKKRNSL